MTKEERQKLDYAEEALESRDFRFLAATVTGVMGAAGGIGLAAFLFLPKIAALGTIAGTSLSLIGLAFCVSGFAGAAFCGLYMLNYTLKSFNSSISLWRQGMPTRRSSLMNIIDGYKARFPEAVAA